MFKTSASTGSRVRAALAAALFLVATTSCAKDTRGFSERSTSPQNLIGKPSALPSGAVLYGVVPALFGNRPFVDVVRKLDDIKALGVDALWISPVFESDDAGIINYSVTNYYKLRKDFGSETEFQNLINEAHARGLRVLMDMVPNHTSNRHPNFVHAETHGEGSEFYSFYDRDDEGQATYYFNWSNLMNLNYSNPVVRNEMKNIFRYWVQKFGIDGYRVDAAWGPEQRAPGFWQELTTDLRSVNPNVIMIAEAGALDSTYTRQGFDFAYDWNKELGHWAWENAFTDSSKTASVLKKALVESTDGARTLRFINNNDTGTRFIERYGLEATKLAAILTQTLPGLPLVYTGDEVGAKYSPYDDPAPLKWNDPQGLRSFYKNLISIRRSTEALRSGDFRVLKTQSNLLAFQRTSGVNTAIVAINLSREPARLELGSAKWTDALSKISHQGSITVQPEQALILTRNER
jgi:cyclomaltodextrinase / maltogenic alpha-amylase / neopullulanase